MASIEIDIRSVVKGLSNMSKNLGDMTKFFKNVSELELSNTMMRFREEEAPDGSKWPDPVTIRRDGSGSRGNYTREQSWNYVLKSNYHAAPPGYHFFDRSRGDKVLRDTGTLMRSIGVAYGKDYAIVGTNIEYAKKLQEGRFPFLGITKKTEDNITMALEAYLKGILK